MQILLYVGQAVARDQVLAFSKQLIPLATRLTLVATGSDPEQSLIADAMARLEIPATLPVTRRMIADNVHDAIITAASEAPYDLVVLGKLHRPLARLLGRRSKAIAQRVQPSVLRVQGRTGPIGRVLVASGGDFHTFDDVRVAAQVAGPLGAEITLMHVVSQQSLVFQGFAQRTLSVDEFLTSTSAEASTLRRAAELLRERDIAVQVRGRVGPVLDELLDELRSGQYDLLVVGAHRIERPLDRILLENITGELLDISPIPVLVVKGHPTDE
jgi:nucleotide-binding universal stress UspA family protein